MSSDLWAAATALAGSPLVWGGVLILVGVLIRDTVARRRG